MAGTRRSTACYLDGHHELVTVIVAERPTNYLAAPTVLVNPEKRETGCKTKTSCLLVEVRTVRKSILASPLCLAIHD